MKLSREETMGHIANEIQIFVNQTAEEKIEISYMRMTARQLAGFSEWARSKFHLVKGDEYFLITKCGVRHYMVNITGESSLTAVKELMDKIAAKF